MQGHYTIFLRDGIVLVISPKVIYTNSMDDRHPRIEWHYEGKPDLLMGTGATAAERALAQAAGGLAAALYAYAYAVHAFPWAWWQYALAALLALDVGGGVVANSLNACKRFYHTPPRPDEPPLVALAKRPWAFVTLHVHPILVGLIFGPGDWFYGLGWYLLLLVSTLAVLRMPLYLRRPVAMLTVLAALLLNQQVIPPVPGFEWFAPALFLKIAYGHLVREEPYAPPH